MRVRKRAFCPPRSFPGPRPAACVSCSLSPRALLQDVLPALAWRGGFPTQRGADGEISSIFPFAELGSRRRRRRTGGGGGLKAGVALQPLATPLGAVLARVGPAQVGAFKHQQVAVRVVPVARRVRP